MGRAERKGGLTPLERCCKSKTFLSKRFKMEGVISSTLFFGKEKKMNKKTPSVTITVTGQTQKRKINGRRVTGGGMSKSKKERKREGNAVETGESEDREGAEGSESGGVGEEG